MKEYNLILQIPDNFNPEELELRYTNEGEVNPAVEVKDELKENSVVVFKFPSEVDPDSILLLHCGEDIRKRESDFEQAD